MKPPKGVKVCDECKKSIAESKCYICNKDLCQGLCNYIWSLTIVGQTIDDEKRIPLTIFSVCGHCDKALDENKKDVHDIIVGTKQFKSFLKKYKETALKMSAINPGKDRPKTRASPAGDFSKYSPSRIRGIISGFSNG